MLAASRRYDIDWLRVIAIGLLLIYHIAIGFQPWGIFIRFIQNSESWDSLWIPMSMLNVWRIPLLFFVSGMGVYLAIRRRNWKQLMLERSKRILLPFVFGIVAIVPLHIFLWQDYYHQDLDYLANPAHLWFLGNIFIYVLVLSPVFFYLKKHEDGKIHRFITRLLSNPAGLLALMLPFVLEAIIIAPEAFELYAMTYHGFWLGMVAFLTGFCCMYAGISFWNTVKQWRWMLFALALTLYIIRLIFFEMKTPDYLLAIESNLWIFAVFGFAYKYLNHGSKTLSYLSQAAYPIYILHMVFLYLGSTLLFGMDLQPYLKFTMLILFTGGGCFISYELIRRTQMLRPLFGLK
jgi:glucan biosynthesis protein C